MFAEAAWIMSGMNTVRHIAPYSNRIAEFSDDGVFFKGAYGPKITDQLPYVVECLSSDKDSRQALINIWRENPRQSKDVPCTVSLQFLLREGKLFTIATMRSSDVWLGLPYDVFNFTMISVGVLLLLAKKTGEMYDLGNLTITAGSGHLYVTNKRLAEECFRDFGKQFEGEILIDPYEKTTYEELVDHLWRCARATSQEEYGHVFGRIHEVAERRNKTV